MIEQTIKKEWIGVTTMDIFETRKFGTLNVNFYIDNGILYIVEYNCLAKDVAGKPIQLYAGEEIKILDRNFFKDSEIYCLRRGLRVYIKNTKPLRKAIKEEEDAYLLYQRKTSMDIWYEAIRKGVLESKKKENEEKE